MMTIDDMQRVLAVPCDPASAAFGPATMEAGGVLAMAATEHKGLRAALLEAVQLLMVGIAVEADSPRAALDAMLDELGEQARELLVLTGHARLDS